jgi:hypothetical protein
MTEQNHMLTETSSAVALANGGPKTKRRDLDFYPTPAAVTQALLLFLALKPCVIWEPACGDGAMSRVLTAAGHTVLSTDIRHTGFGQGDVDFLTAEPLLCDAIITNPPFASSEEFIDKALRTARAVAMLLKSQYWHAQKRYSLFTNHPPAFVLPLTWRPDFLNGERGGNPTMECLWTVWIAGQTETQYQPLPKPKHDGFL